MNAVTSLSPGAVTPTYARPAVLTQRSAAADGVARGPAVMFGGGLASVAAIRGPDAIGSAAGVAPVPPVKPVVYRPGSLVSLSI